MNNNDDIPTTNMTEIKQLINRIKRGELDQGDAQLIEKLLNILLTIVSLLQRKHSVPSVTRRIEKKARKADESSQSIASCGNGLPKYLSFQVKR